MADKHMFKYHKLNDAGQDKAAKIADLFIKFTDELATIVPEGRELSIVKTKLEEACFFAKKGMAIQGDHHEEVK